MTFGVDLRRNLLNLNYVRGKVVNSHCYESTASS